jgi:hypothetical protein
MKKDATLRARVPKHIAAMVSQKSLDSGFFNMTDYIRLAVLEKLAKDTNKTIEEIVKGY